MALVDLPLLQEEDFTLLGSFGISGDEFDFGGCGMSFDPDGDGGNGSIYLSGASNAPMTVGQIAIPALSGSASVLTSPVTVPNPGGLDRVGGTLIYNGRLIISGFEYYDGDTSATKSHWRSSDLTVGNAGSPKTVGTLNPAFYGGYMGLIPEEWQAALGGPCFTGQGCVSIISRTSLGMCMHAFDPDAIAGSEPITVQSLLYYPEAHPMDGTTAADQSPYWNGSTQLSGAFFPPGTRSVCFVGRHGTGTVCYGTGTQNGGSCVDPFLGGQTYHAYPYVHRLWAFDALDLQAVKDGSLDPWEVMPYAYWDLPGIGTENEALVPYGGLAYDPASRRVYIARGTGDAENFGSTPLISVWEHADFSEVDPEPEPGGEAALPQSVYPVIF